MSANLKGFVLSLICSTIFLLLVEKLSDAKGLGLAWLAYLFSPGVGVALLIQWIFPPDSLVMIMSYLVGLLFDIVLYAFVFATPLNKYAKPRRAL